MGPPFPCRLTITDALSRINEGSRRAADAHGRRERRAGSGSYCVSCWFTRSRLCRPEESFAEAFSLHECAWIRRYACRWLVVAPRDPAKAATGGRKGWDKANYSASLLAEIGTCAHILRILRTRGREGARLAARRASEEQDRCRKDFFHICLLRYRLSGKGRMPLAGAAKPLKRLKTAMGAYWKKLGWIWVWRHIRLGSAPHPLGVGATSAWVWRHVCLGA
jgi:hypothetical protein